MLTLIRLMCSWNGQWQDIQLQTFWAFIFWAFIVLGVSQTVLKTFSQCKCQKMDPQDMCKNKRNNNLFKCSLFCSPSWLSFFYFCRLFLILFLPCLLSPSPPPPHVVLHRFQRARADAWYFCYFYWIKGLLHNTGELSFFNWSLKSKATFSHYCTDRWRLCKARRFGFRWQRRVKHLS